MTPRDFDEGHINELATPGCDVEISKLIGVVGPFELNPDLSKTQSIELPEIVKAPSISVNEESKLNSEEKSITESDVLPPIMSFSAQKSHHVETDRTIRAMTIRHTIKNVSKPIDMSS